MADKNCKKCLGYLNSFADGRCDLGFKMEEFWIIDENGLLSIAVHSAEKCTVKMARTRKDFIKKAAERGIK